MNAVLTRNIQTLLENGGVRNAARASTRRCRRDYPLLGKYSVRLHSRGFLRALGDRESRVGRYMSLQSEFCCACDARIGGGNFSLTFILSLKTA